MEVTSIKLIAAVFILTAPLPVPLLAPALVLPWLWRSPQPG
jgi:hypothetical protein